MLGMFFETQLYIVKQGLALTVSQSRCSWWKTFVIGPSAKFFRKYDLHCVQKEVTLYKLYSGGIRPDRQQKFGRKQIQTRNLGQSPT